MKKLINLLLGYVQVRGAGEFPERLVNLCAQHRLAFWELRWLDETTFTLRVRWGELSRLEGLAERAMCTLSVEGSRGVLPFLASLRRRWGFVLGLAAALLAVTVLSRFVLVVEVTGNQAVPTAVILSQLQRLGVKPGVYGPALERREIANQALIALPELSFMAVNLHGTRVEVIVREADPKPELLDEDTPADIIAAADGIIMDIQATAGRPLFQDGDTVAKGETLISGDMELYEPEGSNYDQGLLVVRATGTVTARTWRIFKGSIPLSVQEKQYTGEARRLHTLKFLWGRVDFFQNSGIPYDRYDKITSTVPLTLFGRALPVSWITTTCRAYTTQTVSADREAVEVLLREELLSRLADTLSATEGTVLRADYVAEERDGLLTVTMLAECEEQIGVTVEREGPVGHLRGDNPVSE